MISKDIRDKVDPSLTFEKAIQNPISYKGKTVVWGGEIVETLNQKNGTTEIEVFQIPLDSTDAPKASNVSEGRFLILVNKYLDPHLYRKGRKITVAGKILGEQIKPLGEMDYRYPLVSSEQIHLWEEYYYYRPYPYYYPWGYYDPWWGYPYWWGGLGFSYYYYPHAYYYGRYYGGHHRGYHGGYHGGDYDGHHAGGYHGKNYGGGKRGGSHGGGHRR